MNLGAPKTSKGLHWFCRTFRAADVIAHEKGKDRNMSAYIISGVLALGLLVYLFVALLKPEKF